MEKPNNILKFVVAAKGNLALAAERAKLTQEDLVRLLVEEGHGDSLMSQLRAMLIINMFDSLMMTQIAYQASIDQLTPKEAAQAYTAIASTLQQLTKTEAPAIEDTELHDATLIRHRLASKFDSIEKQRRTIEGQAESV